MCIHHRGLSFIQRRLHAITFRQLFGYTVSNVPRWFIARKNRRWIVNGITGCREWEQSLHLKIIKRRKRSFNEETYGTGFFYEEITIKPIRRFFSSNLVDDTNSIQIIIKDNLIYILINTLIHVKRYSNRIRFHSPSCIFPKEDWQSEEKQRERMEIILDVKFS